MEITFEQLPKAFTTLFSKVENIERLLQQRTEASISSDELLSIQQAADFVKLSVATIYSLVSQSAIPVNKKGKRLYFSKQELTDWIKSGRRKTQSEIQAETDLYLEGKKKGGK